MGMNDKLDNGKDYFWFTRWMRKIYVKHPNIFSVVAATLPVVVTAVVGYLSLETIGKAFFDPPNFTLNWKEIDWSRVSIVCLISFLSYLFVATQYVRIREDRAEKAGRYELDILLPSITWILSANRDDEHFAIAALRPYFEKIDTFEAIDKSDTQFLAKEFHEVSESLEMVLGAFIRTANKYSLASTKGLQSASFGGSLMIGIPQSDIDRLRPEYKIIEDVDNPKGLIKFSSSQEEALGSKYLLVLPKSMRLRLDAVKPTDLKNSDPTLDPLFILPVNHRNSGALVLPGAPEAMFLGGMSSYKDMRSLSVSERFNKVQKAQLKTYFGPKGKGASIRSIYSYRIDDSTIEQDGQGRIRTVPRPIGVISLDSSITNIFGVSDKQYALFSAILSRVLPSVAPALDYYARLWLILQATDSTHTPATEKH